MVRGGRWKARKGGPSVRAWTQDSGALLSHPPTPARSRIRAFRAQVLDKLGFSPQLGFISEPHIPHLENRGKRTGLLEKGFTQQWRPVALFLPKLLTDLWAPPLSPHFSQPAHQLLSSTPLVMSSMPLRPALPTKQRLGTPALIHFAKLSRANSHLNAITTEPGFPIPVGLKSPEKFPGPTPDHCNSLSGNGPSDPRLNKPTRVLTHTQV